MISLAWSLSDMPKMSAKQSRAVATAPQAAQQQCKELLFAVTQDRHIGRHAARIARLWFALNRSHIPLLTKAYFHFLSL